MESGLTYLVLALGGLLMVFPFLWMVSTSLKGQVYVLESIPHLVPQAPTWGNFVEAWTSSNFQAYFANSLAVAVTTTVLSVLFSAMLAYAFARFEFGGKEIIFYCILFSLMIPGIVLILPQFLLAKSLGLRNTLWGLVCVYVATSIPLNTFLLRGFFEQFPRELEDAALMDGGDHFTVFFRLVLPLSKGVLATVSIFSFLGAWDELVWALTAIDQTSKRTLPVAIAIFQGGQHATQWGLVFAASLIAVAPVILVFLMLQRYFVGDLWTGAWR
ncbi:MAG: carbohydrate ABC transporter permease [Chloroflexi bacterium]|nr:carbohydrate ABC transporter permease [Chloroflexota bacterium]